jgi:hypothetical protein
MAPGRSEMVTRGVCANWRSRSTGFAAVFGLACVFCVVACSKGERAVARSGRGGMVEQVIRANEVLLVPLLQGGAAGWCLRDVSAASSRCGVPEVSDGPIFTEGCNAKSATVIEAFALTTGSTFAVSVAGGAAVPTRRVPALADGLRSAWVELRYSKHPTLDVCPRFTAVGRSTQMDTDGVRHSPLGVLSASALQWRRTKRLAAIDLPNGVCEISPAEVSGFRAESGAIVRRLSPSHGLFGRAFVSCASAIYSSGDHSAVAVAVLLSASNPGATPGPLPGMTQVVGHPGVFQAQGPGGKIVARLLSGGWLVVEEGGSGLEKALNVLQQLHATVHL